MRQIEKKIDNTAPSSTGRLPAKEWNQFMDEGEQAVSTAGITLDTTEDTDTQMLAQAMARYASGGLYGRDLGAANAYVIVSPLSFITPKALFEGMTVRFWPKNNNSGASTLNAFALGSKKLLDQDGNALSSGAIRAGRTTEATYDPSLDTGTGAWKLNPASNQGIVSGGGTGTPGDAGVGSSTLRPCLSGITGVVSGLASCGTAISNADGWVGTSDDYAFNGAFATPGPGTPASTAIWEPGPGYVATENWIGWDFGSGYYGTVNQAKFQQFHNASNRTDVWTTVQVEASQDLLTWVPIAVFTSCTHPGDNENGVVEQVSFSNYNARAFRLRPTAVTRYSSAAVLTQTPIIVEVQFIKT